MKTKPSISEKDKPTIPQEEPMKRPFYSGTVYEVKGLKYWLILFPLSLLLKLYYATLKLELEDRESKTAISSKKHPMTIVVWHNRSLIFPKIVNHYRSPLHVAALISPSKAAAWQDGLFKTLNFRCIRGSSTRRSIQSTREMINASREGYDLAISPDGPSGPKYICKKGALSLSKMTNSKTLLISAHGSGIRLKTWDNHFIPFPFSTVKVKARILPTYDKFFAKMSAKTALETLRKDLMSITID